MKTNAWWSWSREIFFLYIYAGKHHHCSLLQCIYEPPKFIRVVLRNTVKSTRKVRWLSCSIGADLQCKDSLIEGHLVLSILHVVAIVDVRWPMQTKLVGLGLHFDSGSEFIHWNAFQNHVCAAIYLQVFSRIHRFIWSNDIPSWINLEFHWLLAPSLAVSIFELWEGLLIVVFSWLIERLPWFPQGKVFFS